MAETKIQWCDYTFNPWRGCTKVSPGCTNCYAESMGKRNPAVLGEWGPGGKRVIAGDAYWRLPIKWDRDAKVAGERRRVFCASLADVFEEREELIEPRLLLWSLIDQTPNLDWLLLTKRPEHLTNAWQHQQDREMLPWERNPWPNVWLGVSVEDQQRADERIPILLQIPAAVRFLSAEPLLGPVDLETRGYLTGRSHVSGACVVCGHPVRCRCEPGFPSIDWVIIGGESGPKSRPCDLAWIRFLVQQCRAAGVACFVKQLGANIEACDVIDAADNFPGDVKLSEAKRPNARVHLRDSKGGEPSEWPRDLRVREFPR